MRAKFAILCCLIAGSAFAQATVDREPKGIRDANKFTDRVQARQDFDKAAAAMLAPKFRQAIASYQPGGASDLVATWAEFVTASGTEFLALQLALPPDSGLRAAKEYTLFGIVANDEGKQLATYNETIPVRQSKGDLFIERSLIVPAQKLRGTFGLANRNEILGIARVDFDPEAIHKDEAGISRIIASSDVHLMPSAQSPIEPFAFGGTKVVPKPRAAFHAADEVWLFAELRNPKLGDDGAPHVATKVEVDGPKKLPGRVIPAEASALKGVPGHYGIGNTIDVSQLVPGDYTLHVTVFDTVAKQSFKRDAVLRIVE